MTTISHAQAGMDVLAALRGQVAPTTAPPAAPDLDRSAVEEAVAPAGERAVATPAATVVDHGLRQPERAAPADPARARQQDFGTRRGAQRLAGLLLLLVAPLAGLAGWAAYTARDATYAGVALILGTLCLGLWFLRVMAVPVTVSLRGPALEVQQGDRRLTWDLSSPYSPIDHVRGRPGRPGWRVVLRNPDGSHFVLDSGMVPPARFMETLRTYRPEH